MNTLLVNFILVSFTSFSCYCSSFGLFMLSPEPFQSSGGSKTGTTEREGLYSPLSKNGIINPSKNGVSIIVAKTWLIINFSSWYGFAQGLGQTPKNAARVRLSGEASGCLKSFVDDEKETERINFDVITNNKNSGKLIIIKNTELLSSGKSGMRNVIETVETLKKRSYK